MILGTEEIFQDYFISLNAFCTFSFSPKEASPKCFPAEEPINDICILFSPGASSDH